jgi:hypothetical protein
MKVHMISRNLPDIFGVVSDYTYYLSVFFIKKLNNIAFASTLHECEIELRSVLEDWILVGLKLKHTLPVIADIDLNKEIHLEQIGSV